MWFWAHNIYKPMEQNGESNIKSIYYGSLMVDKGVKLMQWPWDNCISRRKRIKLHSYLTGHMKTKNVRAKIIKLLEKKHRFMSLHSWIKQWLVSSDTKSISNQSKKQAILDFIQTKNFCISKDTIKKVKKQLTARAMIFASHISDRGLVSRIYKQP